MRHDRNTLRSTRTAASVLAAAFTLALAGSTSPAFGQPSSTPDRQIALTFDDLPMTGGPSCDPRLVAEVTAKLTGFLAARSMPAAGLASPGRPCFDAALLRETLGRWREIGAVVGNHTSTHPDLNSTPVETYLANLDRAQRLIDESIGPERRWFRPPYLHMGDDARSKAALERHLSANGYQLAPVTVDNQEWVYAAVYQHAKARGEVALLRRLVDAYLEHLAASMEFYERLSMDVFGREIPQVLLLHANPLNADHIGAVTTMLENRGYRFVGLADAVSDSAYARPDTYVGPRGLSWIQRWALEAGVPVPDEPREDAWVAEALERIRSGGMQEADPDHVAILDASRAFSAAYVAGDTAAIRRLYTPNALLLPPEGDVRGRDAIVRYFGPGPRRRNLAHAMLPDELRVDGSLAVDVGTWSNVWSFDDGPAREASGRYLVVWERGDDGRWRIRYDMWHRSTD